MLTCAEMQKFQCKARRDDLQTPILVRHEILPRKTILAISRVLESWTRFDDFCELSKSGFSVFIFFNMGEAKLVKIINNYSTFCRFLAKVAFATVVLLKLSALWLAIRTANHGIACNFRTRTTGKVHVIVVDDQIELILLRSASVIYTPIHTVGIRKASHQWIT